MQPELSVIIPTYNGASRIKETLKSLVEQTLNYKLFEIIVVDDGSTDNTEGVVSNVAATTDHVIRYFRQPKQSVSIARNFGIAKARARIIMMLDNDIVVNPVHLALHHAIHTKQAEREVAVLSKIRPPKGEVDLLRNEGTPKFTGWTKHGEPIVDASRLATGAISLKKSFLVQAGMFIPELTVQEDLDLAYRLQQNGLILLYCKEAVAIHMGPLDSLEKIVSYGKKYGNDFARNYGRIPLYGRDCWRLGGRFNGGWHHFHLDPVAYFKDAIRRWLINRLTIGFLTSVASMLPITDPPSRFLKRLCTEIWAYHYRRSFWEGMRENKLSEKGEDTHQVQTSGANSSISTDS